MNSACTVHAFKNIKNESDGTIHTFKNNFVTVFLVFSFQFSVSTTISLIQTKPICLYKISCTLYVYIRI